LRITFPKPGNHIVEEPEYDEKNQRVYVNERARYIWKYTIGAYPVLYKWLKDRKGLKLTLKEIERYRRIATAIFNLKEIMEKIDKLFEGILESSYFKINFDNNNPKLNSIGVNY